MITCEQIRGSITTHFVRQRALPAAVDEHLTSCDACRDVYHRLFEVEAALAKHELTGVEKELLLERILPRVRGTARRGFGWALLVSTAAAAGVVALVARLSGPTDEMAARGAPAALAPVGLRALCLSSVDGRVTARSLTSGAGDGACHHGEALGFAYRNATGEPRYLQILVHTADGALRRVFPATGPAFQIGPTDNEQPLELEVPLNVFPTGALTVHGVFSRTFPPAAATLDRDLLPEGSTIVSSEIRVREAAP